MPENVVGGWCVGLGHRRLAVVMSPRRTSPCRTPAAKLCMSSMADLLAVCAGAGCEGASSPQRYRVVFGVSRVGLDSSRV
jgi:hypothetical protein